MNFVQVTEELLRKLADLVGNPSERVVVHKLVDELPHTGADAVVPDKEPPANG